MSELIVGQENNDLSQSHSFAKNQISAKTSATILVSDMKTCSIVSKKSSRKAFGNVSNVVMASKSVNSMNKAVDNKCVTNTTIDDNNKVSNESKCFDEIENMDSIKQEELSEFNDPITANLFAIDDSIIYSQQFDDDISDHLMAPNITQDDIDFIF